MKYNNIIINNNKIIAAKAVLIVVALGIIISCSEEFLKPDPLSFFEPTKTFGTIGGLNATMAMCDRHLRQYWSHNDVNRDRSLPISTEAMFSEQAVGAQTDNTAIFANIADALTPTNRIDDGDANCIKFFWDEHYQGIKYANSIIGVIDKVDGLSDDVKKATLGRAYFHRAFRYMALVFQFGDVPLITKILESPKFNYKTTSREAILAMITEDMEKAVEWVPDQKDMTMVGMINKGACRQLLIKCYLATGQYDKAIQQADILINSSGYSLMKEPFGTFINPMPKTWNITRNVIWDMHRPENRSIPANKETILSLPNAPETTASIRYRSMRNWLPMLDNQSPFLMSPGGTTAIVNYNASSKDYRDTLDYRVAHGRGIAHIRPTWYTTHSVWYVNGKDDATDLRHNSDVGNWVRMELLKYNNTGAANSAWFGKNLRLYADNGTLLCTDTIRSWFDWPHYKTWIPYAQEVNNKNTNDSRGGAGDWYCYRLAETYLLRAEAKFYTGDIAGATADVNEVRKRAKCSELYSTVTIGDIMDERARELYLEEWRHEELVRVSYCLAKSGKADELGKTYSADKLSEDSYWWQRVNRLNGFYNTGAVVWRQSNRPYNIAPRNILWPIPQYAIDANRSGQLRQNYGYSGYDASIPMWTNWQDAVADENKTN